MKNKEFLTEAKRKAIISEKEKAILESFAKTFNKIKRIDENELNEFDGEDYERASRGVQYGIDPYQEQPDLTPQVGDTYTNVNVMTQDGTIQRNVEVVSVYPEERKALVRTDAGGDAIVSFDDLM